MKGITTDRVIYKCRRCDGTGHIAYRTPKGYTKTVRCQRCDGTGIILKIL